MIAFILGMALFGYLVGPLSGSMPLPHIDEQVFVWCPLGFWSGDLNPHFFNYPALPFYVLSLAAKGYQWVLGEDSLSFVARNYFVDGHQLITLARAYVGVSLVATAGLLALLVKEVVPLYRGQKSQAALGVTLFLITPMVVRLGQMATVDALALPWIVATVWMVYHSRNDFLEKDALFRMRLAALLAAVAASHKWTAGLVLGAVWVALWFWHDGTARYRAKQLLTVTAVFAVFFLAFNPFLVLDAPAAWGAFRTLAGEHLQQVVHRDPFALVGRLTWGLGLPLVALVGYAGWGRYRNLNEYGGWRQSLLFQDLPQLTAGGLFLAFALLSTSTFQRYWLPVVPFLVLLATDALLVLVHKRRGWLYGGAIAIQVALSISQGVAIGRPDTRTTVQETMAATGTQRFVLDPGRIADPGMYTPSKVYTRQGHFLSSYSVERLEETYAHLASRTDLPPLYVDWDYASVQSARPGPGRPAQDTLMVIACDHPLCETEKVWSNLPELLIGTDWLQQVEPGLREPAWGQYDLADWWFYPESPTLRTMAGPDYWLWRAPVAYAAPVPSTAQFFQLQVNALQIRRAMKEEGWQKMVDLYRPFVEYNVDELLPINGVNRLYLSMALAYQGLGNTAAAGWFLQELERRAPQ